jgi:hypothetical protein
MKTKLLMLTLFCLSIGLQQVQAQATQDVTETYIVNPSFEEGDGEAEPTYWSFDSAGVFKGWYVSHPAITYNNNDADATKTGTYILGIWGNSADYEVSQIIKDLPAGTYLLSCDMTVPVNAMTTQRLFAGNGTIGYKAQYFGSLSLDTVPGEEYSYAGHAPEGSGAGPLKPLSIMLTLEETDSLVIGVRTNGSRTAICDTARFKKLGGAGWFKIDNFQLHLIPDLDAYYDELIGAEVAWLDSFDLDLLPQGYTPIIDSVKSQAQTLIEGTLPAEEAIAFINQVKSLVEELGLAALAFAELDAYFLQAQDLLENTDFDGKAELEFGVSEAASLIEAETCVLADFEAAIAVIWQAIKAYTAGNIEENLAAIATLTTSHCSTWETLEAVRDGLVPDSSHFYTYPKYGNWDGSARKLHWVQYEWEKSYRVTQIGVFWWTDFGGLLQPDVAYVEYWFANDWVKLDDIGTDLHKFNYLSDLDVTTDKVRICMSSAVSTGISEFSVLGLEIVDMNEDYYKYMIQSKLYAYQKINTDSIPLGHVDQVIDFITQAEELLAGTESADSLAVFDAAMTEFLAVIYEAQAAYAILAELMGVSLDLITNTDFEGKDALVEADEEAYLVFEGAESTLEDFLAAVELLGAAIEAYTAGNIEINLALEATVSTSHCSAWESLAAVNDDIVPTNSYDRPRYGNWDGRNSVTHWVQYDWPAAQRVTKFSVYWGTDDGGLLIPHTAYVEYWNETMPEDEWTMAGDIGIERDMFNDLAVDTIEAAKVRISMISDVATSIVEFQVWGFAVEYVDGIAAPVVDKDLKVFVQDGRLVVLGVSEYQVYSILGHQINPAEQLKQGIYIVKAGNKAAKVLVR